MSCLDGYILDFFEEQNPDVGLITFLVIHCLCLCVEYLLRGYWLGLLRIGQLSDILARECVSVELGFFARLNFSPWRGCIYHQLLKILKRSQNKLSSKQGNLLDLSKAFELVGSGGQGSLYIVRGQLDGCGQE